MKKLLIAILNKDPYEQIDAIGDCVVVLTILSNQLGFDIDEWSVENSIENASLNGLNDIRFDLGTIRDRKSVV